MPAALFRVLAAGFLLLVVAEREGFASAPGTSRRNDGEMAADSGKERTRTDSSDKEELADGEPERARKEADAIDLHVMTFNIRHGLADDGENSWPYRVPLVIDLIGEKGPDVFGIQEAHAFQIEEIREALPRYGEIGAGRDDGKLRGEHCSILYRTERFRVDAAGTFWLSDTPEVPGSKHWGNRVTRVCTWARLIEEGSGVGFYVYNTHLDHESQEARERSVELLARRIRARERSEDPCLIIGDFNAPESSPPIRYLRGEIDRAVPEDRRGGSAPPLRDAFRFRHPEAARAGTFHGFRGGDEGPRIDYIFVSPLVEVLESRIVRWQRGGRYPSDHYPVTAEIRLPRLRRS